MAYKSAGNEGSSFRAKNHDEVHAAFETAVLKVLKLDLIRKVYTIPVPKASATLQFWEPKRSYTPGIKIENGPEVKYLDVDEFADWANLTVSDAVEKATMLGHGCGVLYNCLVNNALRTKEHKIVFDLFNNNLKFNYVHNAEPSVADPMGIIPGWVSFRFHFYSSDSFKGLGMSDEETLTRLEAFKARHGNL
jgi:hypothetical protein